MRITKQILIAASAAMILSGSLLIYFYHYKDNFVNGISYLLLVPGWLMLLTVLYGWRTLFPEKLKLTKNKIKQNNKMKWFQEKVISFSFLIVMLIVLNGNIILASKLANSRVSYILSSGNIQITDATNTESGTVYSRRGADISPMQQ